MVGLCIVEGTLSHRILTTHNEYLHQSIMNKQGFTVYSKELNISCMCLIPKALIRELSTSLAQEA